MHTFVFIVDSFLSIVVDGPLIAKEGKPYDVRRVSIFPFDFFDYYQLMIPLSVPSRSFGHSHQCGSAKIWWRPRGGSAEGHEVPHHNRHSSRQSWSNPE